MSIHDHVLQVLSAMLDGDVDPELRGLAEDHLQRCRRCHSALDAFTRVDALAREVLLPSDPAPFEAALADLDRLVAAACWPSATRRPRDGDASRLRQPSAPCKRPGPVGPPPRP